MRPRARGGGLRLGSVPGRVCAVLGRRTSRDVLGGSEAGFGPKTPLMGPGTGDVARRDGGVRGRVRSWDVSEPSWDGCRDAFLGAGVVV